MQRREFLDLVKNPFPVNEKSLEQVKEIVVAFPYFQTAQLLYAKLLKESNDIHYDHRVKIAAAYAVDRKRLFNLIEKSFTDNIFEPFYRISGNEIKNEFKPGTSLTKDIENTDIPFTEPLPPEIIRDTEISPGIEPVFPAEIKSESAPSETGEIKEENTAEKENTLIENPVISFEAQESYEIEHFFSKEIIEEEKPPVSDLVEKVEEPIVPAQAEFIPVAEPGQNPDEPPAEKHTFLHWLHRLQHQVASETPQTSAIVSENKPEPAVQKNAEKPLEISAKENPQPPAEKIIETFIKEEPRISPAKAGFFSPVNMARKSVEEHDDLVSPTLARIYLIQGNAQKAISTYEKLSLLYPEKSAFFAAQIEKIKSGS